MKDNSTQTSSLEQRITSQKKQSFNLNAWIFENLDIQGNEEVLELCCGTGAQTNIFSQKLLYGSIVSVDINNESIEKAKKYIKNSQVSFINAGIDDTELYLKKTYDLIFSAYGFYYSINPEILHEKLINSLKSDGRFVIVGPILGNNKQLYSIIKDLGCEIPVNVMDDSEYFMMRFFEIFLKNYKNVKIIRRFNNINYDSCGKLLEYWKNTTFYTPGFDDKFINSSKKYFQGNDIVISKSIAYLEGSL